ncbi:MAG: hypothetical protein WC010_00735 [Candidatus Absconditabacterales bacterium]
MKILDIPVRSIISVIITLAIMRCIDLVIGYIIHDFEIIRNLIPKDTQTSDIYLIWAPISSYLIIGVSVCMIVNVFKKLKSYKENGLILGFLVGILGGILGGLIMGLILGFIVGSIAGIIWGLIVGFIIGIIAGLLVGLVLEFMKESI